MKIRGVMASKGDTPESVRRMQKELFEVLAEAKSREELCRIEPRARGVARMHKDELDNADVREQAINRRAGRLNHSRKCAEAPAVQAHLSREFPLRWGLRSST